MIHTLLLNAQGKVIWLSHGDELHDAKLIIGRKVWELVPDDEREAVRDQLSATVFDNGKAEKVFRSRFVAAAPRYTVKMHRVRSAAVVASVQRCFPAEVTARERDILRMIADDRKPAEIAKRLRLARNTIDSYRRNLKRKLNVAGTAGLVRWAVRAGLVTP
jgi:DNA-binding CsgD family transcriptional regulator